MSNVIVFPQQEEPKDIYEMTLAELQAHYAAMQQELLDKHYLRKHGKNAYYGQK